MECKKYLQRHIQYLSHMVQNIKGKFTFSFNFKHAALFYCRHKYFIFIYDPSLKCYLGCWLCTRPGPMVLRCSIKYKVAPGEPGHSTAHFQHRALNCRPPSGVVLPEFEINQQRNRVDVTYGLGNLEEKWNLLLLLLYKTYMVLRILIFDQNLHSFSL